LPTAFTPSQQAALARFEEFLDSPGRVFLLTGPAGTGKTFLLRAIADTLSFRKLPAAFVAPTGRAARVLESHVGHARTVHSLIYEFDQLEGEHREDGTRNEADIRFHFSLRESNKLDAGVVVVDEASMVGDNEASDAVLKFGSGRLLNDLIRFVFYGIPARSARKIVFVGDPYQLPPVGDPFSRALDPGYLSMEYGLESTSVALGDIVRQEAGSGVLELAGEVRDALDAHRYTALRLRRPAAGVKPLGPGELTDSFIRELREIGVEETLMIVRRNERALRHNQIVRERLIGMADAPPQAGDRVVIVQNSHLYQFVNGEFGRLESCASKPEVRKARGWNSASVTPRSRSRHPTDSGSFRPSSTSHSSRAPSQR
jgi:hypothetical protein